MWKSAGALFALAALQAQVEAAPAPAVVTIWQTATKVVYANGNAYTTVAPAPAPSPSASTGGGFNLDNLLQDGKVSEWLAYFKGNSQTPSNVVVVTVTGDGSSTPSPAAPPADDTTSAPAVQFQAATTPATTSVAQTTAAAAPSSTSSSSDSDSGSDSSLSGFSKDILDAHNADRAKHNVAALSWDSTLESYAQNYADAYDCSGNLKHSGGPYGENLACGYADGPAAVQAWYDEGQTYTYGSSSVYDHFTQVVWKSTTKVGCAYKDCRSNNWGLYIICSYDPAGNVVGQSASNVLPPN